MVTVSEEAKKLSLSVSEKLTVGPVVSQVKLQDTVEAILFPAKSITGGLPGAWVSFTSPSACGVILMVQVVPSFDALTSARLAIFVASENCEVSVVNPVTVSSYVKVTTSEELVTLGPDGVDIVSVGEVVSTLKVILCVPDT